MKKYLAICTILLLSSNISRAQLILSNNSTPLEIQTSVHQLDQFIGRFGYQLDFTNKPVTDDFMKKYSRKLVISLLLDQEDKRFDTASVDQAYVDQVKKFITYVVDNNLTINRDNNLYVVLNGQFLCQGKSIPVQLLMQYYYHGENAYSWKIIDVYSTQFDFAGTEEITKYIPPNNDEMGFMYLQRAFEDVENLGNYTDTTLIQSQLSVFLYLMSQKQITFQQIQDYHYLYIGIKGWCMEIKNFQREGLNTGWLISDIRKFNEEKLLLNKY
ncbi:MAG: hypothetical protein JXB49_26250 [Bacteroidales bacterium]|nr:hypothetical protein [Bacteroidales bacterium]